MQIFDPPIYLDYAASTPVHPQVLDEMLPFLGGEFGNPSSPHLFGRRSRAALDLARDRVAHMLHADSSEVCFTSGGTEADNLAVLGAALNAPAGRRRIVISSVEHHAVLHAAAHLADLGYEVSHIPVSGSCALNMDDAESLIDESTALVSIMLANNETGVVFPVKKIARLAHAAGALMHTDAVQAAGLVRLEPGDLGVDLLSISAHKFYGPKGAGALWVRRGVKLMPVLFGGAQERQRRAGTEDVANLVGMGKAADLVLEQRAEWLQAIAHARNAFAAGFSGLDGIQERCTDQRCLPNIVNCSIRGVDAELLTMRLDGQGIAISTGAACASGSREPSHVLTAMGLKDDDVRSSVRISFGRTSDPKKCELAGRAIAATVAEMRSVAGKALMEAKE